MPLTPAQYEILKTDILVTNQEEFADMVAAREDQLIADAYNQLASPEFWVWRVVVPKEEMVGEVSQEGTSFTWAGTGFIGKSVQEILTWQELFDARNNLNPSLPQVRQALIDIFSGTGAAASNRTHILSVIRRRATRAEHLFATGTGTPGSPGTMTFVGFISYLDIAYVIG
jgi:hypothetical protein